MGIGGLAVTLVGRYADHFGIDAAIRLIFILPLLGGFLGLFLKGAKAKKEQICA